MKSKLEIINQNPEHLKYANRMVHVKQVQSNFVRKSLPIRLVLFDEPPQNIFQRCGHEEVLLLQNQLLYSQWLAWILGIWCTCDLFALFPDLNDILVRVIFTSHIEFLAQSFRFCLILLQHMDYVALVGANIAAKNGHGCPESN